jgi:hypothetical protein
LTVTKNDLVSEDPAIPQVTVLLPIENIDPEGGLQFTGILFPLVSEADAEYVTAAPSGPVASTILFEGTLMLCSETILFKLPEPSDRDDEVWPTASCVKLVENINEIKIMDTGIISLTLAPTT